MVGKKILIILFLSSSFFINSSDSDAKDNAGKLIFTADQLRDALTACKGEEILNFCRSKENVSAFVSSLSSRWLTKEEVPVEVNNAFDNYVENSFDPMVRPWVKVGLNDSVVVIVGHLVGSGK